MFASTLLPATLALLTGFTAVSAAPALDVSLRVKVDLLKTKACQSSVRIVEQCDTSGTVALTFDDAPYLYERNVSDILTGAGVQGTFFLNGNNYDCIYDHADTMQYLLSRGHIMGNHGWSHANMSELTETQMNQELEQVEVAFQKILGLRPLYFRPPFGEINDLLLKVLGQRGYTTVFLWSDDTEDSSGPDVTYQESVIDDLADKYPTPGIVLQHSAEPASLEVTPYAIQKLKSAGYQLVSGTTCISAQPGDAYKRVGKAGTRDSSCQC